MAGPAVGRLHPGRPGESKGQPKLVDVLSVRLRTWVRFPPPPFPRHRSESWPFGPRLSAFLPLARACGARIVQRRYGVGANRRCRTPGGSRREPPGAERLADRELASDLPGRILRGV